MEEECKGREKAANVLEKHDPQLAIEKYLEAADCFANLDKTKNQMHCLIKVADIYRLLAKNTDDPVEAYEIYGQASRIYEQGEKTAEAVKVQKEANRKLLDCSKKLQDEARKILNPIEAEEKFAIAATYATHAGDTDLANNCWIDSANQFRKAASLLEDPREALEIYKHAIKNLRNANDVDQEEKTWDEAASKFYAKGEVIEKTKTGLVYAIDYYLQAYSLFTEANIVEKSSAANIKIDELCSFIGLPLDYVTAYFNLKDINPVSLTLEE